MNILVIGSGGREHALAWKSAQDKSVANVFVCPGNAGTALEEKVTNISIDADNFEVVEKFCKENNWQYGLELGVWVGVTTFWLMKNTNLKIGVLVCMAERLKEKFLIEEKIVDLVVGPDAYRDIPNLLEEVEIGNSAVNVILSKDETYDNIDPSRLDSNGISAFVSITRGCDNMCTFCVVPFTRGRERSSCIL